MTKNEFLNQLRKKLDILSKDELEELIAEYSEHIDHKMSEGKSEEEAVKDFGDIGELTVSILQAYKLNANFTNKPKFAELLQKSEASGRKFLHSFEEFYSKISLSEVFKYLILIILSFGLVAVLKFPFMMFRSISLWFLEIIFGYRFVSLFDGIWTFVVNAIYYLSAILLMMSVVHFGQQRYMHITHRSQKLDKKDLDEFEEENGAYEEAVNEEIHTVKIEPEKVQSKKNKSGGFKEFISKLVNLFYYMIIWSLRLLILAIMFPVILGLIVGLFIWGMLVFLVLSKVPLLGLMFTSGMGLIFAFSILYSIFAFVFGLKSNKWRISRVFSIILITLILGGFGTIWSLNELSQFEWVENDSDYIEQKYELNEIDKITLINAWTEFVIDNSLEDGEIICAISSDENRLMISKDNKNILISMNDYTDVDEINLIRLNIVRQFNALKERKLIFSFDNYSNRVLIKVNDKSYNLLQNTIDYN